MTNQAKHDGEEAAGFQIFRFEDAPHHMPARPPSGLTEVSSAGLAQFMDARMGDGAEARVLFEAPGFCLMYAWFKSGSRSSAIRTGRTASIR